MSCLETYKCLADHYICIVVPLTCDVTGRFKMQG